MARLTTQTDPESLRGELLSWSAEARAAPGRIRAVRAPGRVNIIGEHTDYNEGYVLPAAIGLEIRVACAPSDDRRVVIRLAESGEVAEFDLDSIGPRQGRWVDYVAGTAWTLAEAGVATRGIRGVLASSLPVGAGLSSSAALELAAAWALSADAPPPLEPMALARAAQRAENEYVGVRCGLMDQFAATLGVAGAALSSTAARSSITSSRCSSVGSPWSSATRARPAPSRRRPTTSGGRNVSGRRP